MSILNVYTQTRGLGYDVPAGRRDGRISLASETLTDLPPPFFTVNQLAQLFEKKGLTQEEMVTLSGKNLPLPKSMKLRQALNYTVFQHFDL